MEYEELYQEILLDHYRHPHHRCPDRPESDFTVKHQNPLCGDELLLRLELDREGRVAEVCFKGHGCSISQASASMMSEAVRGLERGEALELIETVRRMMHGERDGDQDLGDIEALSGVAKFPVRVKCALLAWMALKDALTSVSTVEQSGRS